MSELRLGGATLWVGASLVCGYMTWMAWLGPPPRPISATPEPIQRGITTTEIEAVTRLAMAMTQDINDGSPSAPGSNLEALLSEPIPDNPLVEGVGTHAVSCDTDQKNRTVDWLYCPASRTVRATVPGQ